MEIKSLSDTYEVRKLNLEDIDLIYKLSCKNNVFYQYHPPFVTRESIAADLEALPPGKNDEDKYYVGFFERGKLVAIMDLILDFPTEKVAMIGLFMMNVRDQSKGIGSLIINDCKSCLQSFGYQKIRIGVDNGNTQSNSFWRKNGFIVTGEASDYICMELLI